MVRGISKRPNPRRKAPVTRPNVFEHAMGSDEKLTSAYVCMYNMYTDAIMDKVMTC